MKKDLKKLSFCYPELLRVFRLAATADGNQIYGMALGNRKAKNRIVIQASMHAREWFNTELLMQMAERCCRRWRVRDMVPIWRILWMRPSWTSP